MLTRPWSGSGNALTSGATFLPIFSSSLKCVTADFFTYSSPDASGLLGTFFGTLGTNATFDYVVVSGGTAGLTIATQLAQDPRISVAVVEAGGFYEIDNGNKSIVPGYANYYTGWDPKNYQPLFDWGFVTTPQMVSIAWSLKRENGLY